MCLILLRVLATGGPTCELMLHCSKSLVRRCAAFCLFVWYIGQHDASKGLCIVSTSRTALGQTMEFEIISPMLYVCRNVS